MSSVPPMFGEKHSGSEIAAVESNYIQATLWHGLRIWWAFYWRTAVVSAILVAALILTARPLLFRGAITAGMFHFLMTVGPWAITYAVAVPVFSFILRKKFRDFRIGLTEVNDGAAGKAAEPTLSRTLRIWWTYSWRTIVYRLMLGFIASIPLGIILGTLSGIFPRLAGTFAFLVSSSIEGAAGLFVIYSNILDENFSDFHVSLVPRNAPVRVAAAEIAIPPATI